MLYTVVSMVPVQNENVPLYSLKAVGCKASLLACQSVWIWSLENQGSENLQLLEGGSVYKKMIKVTKDLHVLSPHPHTIVWNSSLQLKLDTPV